MVLYYNTIYIGNDLVFLTPTYVLAMYREFEFLNMGSYNIE